MQSKAKAVGVIGGSVVRVLGMVLGAVRQFLFGVNPDVGWVTQTKERNAEAFAATYGVYLCAHTQTHTKLLTHSLPPHTVPPLRHCSRLTKSRKSFATCAVFAARFSGCCNESAGSQLPILYTIYIAHIYGIYAGCIIPTHTHTQRAIDVHTNTLANLISF